MAHHGNHVHGHSGGPVRLHLVGDRPAGVSAVGSEDDGRDALSDQIVRLTTLHVGRSESSIRVRVEVDEARDHVEAGRVDHPTGRSRRQISHPHDLIAANTDIGIKRRVSGAI